MGLFKTWVANVKSALSAVVPFGGTIDTPSEEDPIIIAQKVKGGLAIYPDLETLADIPYTLLQKDQIAVVSQHLRPSGTLHPRTRYYLYNLPPANTRVSEIGSYVIENYWRKETEDVKYDAEVATQYAPNYLGNRPNFLPTEITLAAYQAGYPTTALYIGGNPADIIWSDTYDPLKNHVWVRQRIGSQPWGIPISLSAGNYETNQYIDVIFRWQLKADPFPSRPVQPNDNSLLPTGWQNTPGSNYATLILTQNLYRSQAVKNAYGILKSEWDIPVLVSSDPTLVRYGNQPGNTDFLNDTYWRGYYTPGLDTFQATRPTGVSTNWTVSKIDQEAGEFQDFVFRAFSIGATVGDLTAGTPTIPVPLGVTAPNDWKDTPYDVAPTEILYMSTAVKYTDGSLKTAWSFPKRFDGLDTIQTRIEETPGDTFYQTRDGSGNLNYAFLGIVMNAILYKGPTAITAGITNYKWYRNGTLIIFSGITFKATNLGGLNNFHTISNGGQTLTVNPEAVDATTTYTAGITHTSRPTDYEDNLQLFDSTDDASSFMADIIAVSGTTFKNQVGLYQFNANFYKGGVLDYAGVIFKWSIVNAAGAALTGALRNAGGVSIGDTNVVATSVYVQGADISSYATLILEGDFGGVTRIHRVTLSDVQDGAAVEVLYWGTGSTDPGPATNFMPRTLTSAEVIALAIGYSATATGRWYMIQRTSGIWGDPIQMRAESARPNGGISLTIYKNVQLSLGAPIAPAVPPTGSIVPAGWTATPTAFAGLEDATFITSCFFILRIDVNADPTILTRANYNPNGTYGTPVRITGIDGTNSSPGLNGTNGWSPIFAIIAYLSGQVIQLVDWTGGTGVKPPAGGTSSYIGPTGLTTIGNAINIKGDPGDTTQVRSQFITETVANGGITNKFTNANFASVGIIFSIGLTLDVTNNGPQARWFIINAEVGCRAANSPGANVVALLEEAGSGYVDIDKQRVEIENVPIPGLGGLTGTQKLRLNYRALIAPGQTNTYGVALCVTDGAGAFHNSGYIQAFGI